jgi:hypothetical protein
VPPLAAAFSDYVLAVHILAVVLAFGVTFAYPLIELASRRLDRAAIPWFHQIQLMLSRRLVQPGLGLVLIAGIVLASDEHQWKHFYVGWGVAAVVVLGAVEGAFMAPRTRRLLALAERDLAAAPDGEASSEYTALRGRVNVVGGLMGLLVAVTVFLMATHA